AGVVPDVQRPLGGGPAGGLLPPEGGRAGGWVSRWRSRGRVADRGFPGSGGPVTDIDEVLDLYDRWGAERYDEDVGQLDHALQTAALAASAGAGDALVVAALLHDVGHLLELRGGPAGPHERTAPA